jgi:hypothetical protein
MDGLKDIKDTRPSIKDREEEIESLIKKDNGLPAAQ